MKRCPYCNEPVRDDATHCYKCGKPLPPTAYSRQPFGGSQYTNTPPPPYSSPINTGFNPNEYFSRNNAFDEGPEGKSRGVAAILAILLGGLGVQYFYLGKIWGGVLCILLTLVTCGLWEVVTLIQGVLMFCMNNAAFRQKYVLTDSTMPLF